MARSSDTFLQQFRAARRVSTPIVNIRTPDPASSVALVTSALKTDTTPLVLWDTMRGLTGLNDLGKQEISRLLGEVTPSAVVAPVEVLSSFYRAAEDTVLFLSMHTGSGQTPQWFRASGMCAMYSKLKERRLFS